MWHVLAEGSADRYASKIGVKNLPDGVSATQFTRNQLDRLQIGGALDLIPWARSRSGCRARDQTKEGSEQMTPWSLHSPGRPASLPSPDFILPLRTAATSPGASTTPWLLALVPHST